LSRGSREELWGAVVAAGTVTTGAVDHLIWVSYLAELEWGDCLLTVWVVATVLRETKAAIYHL
jgi:hypothetical protein